MTWWNWLYASRAPSQTDSQGSVWQPISEIFEFRHLVTDSIHRPVDSFNAYFPLAAFNMVKFSNSDIPNLKDKVILVTGGEYHAKQHLRPSS